MAFQVVVRGSSFLIFLAITTIIFLEINKIQHEPYMDEIFHIPQAQNYCHGYYEHWNNKITTLPGLYLSSQCFLKIVSYFETKTMDEVCDSFMLRCTNILFIIGCYITFRSIATHLDKEKVGDKYITYIRIIK